MRVLVAFLILTVVFVGAEYTSKKVTQIFGDIEKKQLNNMDLIIGSEEIVLDAQADKVIEKIIQFPKVDLFEFFFKVKFLNDSLHFMILAACETTSKPLHPSNWTFR